MSDIADLVQSSDVYDCFDGLHIEVTFMLDYLTAQRKKPQHIYREVRCLARNLVHNLIFQALADN
jgi:E3 ubiquitin-protein ligase CHFR